MELNGTKNFNMCLDFTTKRNQAFRVHFLRPLDVKLFEILKPSVVFTAF